MLMSSIVVNLKTAAAFENEFFMAQLEVLKLYNFVIVTTS